MSLSHYQYQPLKPSEIRLLQLLPRSPDEEYDPIRCNIIHTSFEQCHVPDSFFSYEALSYVWGGDRTVPIYCGDREILATPNLVSALSRLRQKMPKYPGFHRTLWIDAICIDQDDVVERGHQVRLMKDIYSRARRVLIWLGGGKEVEQNLTRIINGNNVLDISIDSRLKHDYPLHLIGVRDTAKWTESISGIFDQAWFQRVWVIQEVAFSRKATVLGGKVSIKWRALVDAAEKSTRNCDLPLPHRIRCDALVGIDRLRREIQKRMVPDSKSKPGSLALLQSGELVDQAVTIKGWNGHPSVRPWQLAGIRLPRNLARLPSDLLELAEFFRSYSATDPRDKIYALLGLAMALETDRLASRIDANYTLSVEDLFLEIAHHVISGPEPLRLIRSVDGSCRKLSRLPSWVPDWSIPGKMGPLSDFCDPGYFLASQRAVILKQPSSGVLKLAGKRIDIVRAVGEVMVDAQGETRLEILERWNSLATKHCTPVLQAFSWNDHPIDQTRGHFCLLDNRTNYGRLIQRLKDICCRYLTQRLDGICLGRRYLITEKGHFGLAPASAKVGDAVVLFPGAQLPFAISHSEQEGVNYLVGECYIDDVNLDEFMREKKNKMDIFCLE